MNYAEQKQDIIDTLDKQIEIYARSSRRRSVRTLKTLPSSMICYSRPRRNAICACFVPTALSEVSLASPEWIPTLLLSPSKVFELPRSTFQHSALTRIRSSLFGDSNKRRATKKIRLPLLKL
ncbi:hypothetical protein L915_20407 [Phytophthora nicotianae]|uniref:Uncharacterized protein n=1 Tax=Phytophthora nicotianae TaxID=4792 RepID=W2FPB7_PHYNI|nr:hypothetical protein L915_20407 [Phytophthora nicotianae]